MLRQIKQSPGAPSRARGAPPCAHVALARAANSVLGCSLALGRAVGYDPVLLLFYPGAGMGTARISSKGQVAIPVALREAIDLRPGAEVSFELAGGAILLRPVPQFKAVTPKPGYGWIPHQGRAASEAAITRAARA